MPGLRIVISTLSLLVGEAEGHLRKRATRAEGLRARKGVREEPDQPHTLATLHAGALNGSSVRGAFLSRTPQTNELIVGISVLMYQSRWLQIRRSQQQPDTRQSS